MVLFEYYKLKKHFMHFIVISRINHHSYLRWTIGKIFKYFVKNISLEDHKRSICFRFSNISIMFLCDAGMWIWNHFIFQYPDWKVNILSKQFFVNTNSFNLWLHIDVAVSSLYQKNAFWSLLVVVRLKSWMREIRVVVVVASF